MKFLSLLSFFVPLVCALTDEDRMVSVGGNLRTHSLYAPYVDQDLQNRWFSFGADAYIDTNRHVRLTRDRPSQTGWLWSRLPLTSTSFQIDVEYKIDGSSTHLFGDGMAIWLTTRRAEVGPVFGFVDEWEGLGIFIDTFANGQHTYSFPRIQAIKGDGKTKYLHDTDGEGQELGGCSAAARRTPVTSKVRIIYIENQFLEVKLQNRAWDEWQSCFVVKGYKLPDSPFLGFSALTGQVSDAHDIIAVTTSHVTLSNQSPRRQSLRSGTGGGFLMGLLKFIGLGVFCVLAFAGWKTYSARNRSWSNKRF